MKETWDFLRGSVPEFQHPDERLSEMKPPAAAPAAEGEPGFNKSPLPGPERSKGPSSTTDRHCVCVCVVSLSHTHIHTHNSQLHTAHLIKLLSC